MATPQGTDAAEIFDVKLMVVDISSHLRDDILRAQGHQVMVRNGEVADDVSLEN
jgi:hypothetical protein